MGQTTIEWTATYLDDGTVLPGYTFNPWSGCIKVSPGCQHCYAETLSKRWGKDVWGPGPKRQRTSVANWKKPLQWNREAESKRVRYKVFCASMADVFEDNPQVEEWRYDLWNLIEETPALDWLLLTKRPENVIPFTRRWSAQSEQEVSIWPDNIWIGTSVEDQQRADERIPHLLQIPAKIRFLSCEPLLGPVDLEDLAYEAAGPEWAGYNALVNWVIVGGESGPGARPMHPGWARSLRDQCQGAGIPFFFKQWGNWLPQDQKPNHNECHRTTIPFRQWSDDPLDYSMDVGKKCAGRLLDGVEYSEFPQMEAV